MRLTAFLVALSGVLLTSAVQAKTFRYFLESVPAQNQKCAAVADAIGQAFGAKTGITSFETRCSHDHKTSFDIEVIYNAEKELNKVSTVSDEFTISGYKGTYRSRQECEESLPQEIEEFEAQTQIAPVVNYCYPLAYAGSTHSYVQKIEGFGTPKNKFFTDEATVSGPATELIVGIQNDIKENLQAQGVDVRRAFLRSSSIGWYATISYYAPHRVGFTNLHTFNYDTAERCEKQVDEINQAFATMESKPLAVYCPAQSGGEIDVLIAGLPFEIRQQSYPYTSFDSCYADRENAIVKYNQTHKLLTAKTGVCEGHQSDFRIHLFVK